MAIPSRRASPNGDQDFAQSSYLTYMIPSVTDFKLKQALEQSGETPAAFFESIEDRESLFLDETVDVHLILRTPYRRPTSLRSYLARVKITLEAKIINSHATDRDSSPAAEVIYNGVVDDTQDPAVIVDEAEDGDDDDAAESHVYAIWKLPVLLSRPRIRLQGPTVSFSAAAALKPAEGPSAQERDGYLQSRTPSGLNLLESFGDDPGLEGVKPRLSAQRVSRVAPVTQPREPLRPIKGLKGITSKIYPAVHTRVRFARPNTLPTGPAIIAMLEIDFTPFFECELLLTNIGLSLPSGVITDLNGSHGLSLPLSCVAHDHVTFIYRLAPKEYEANTSSSPTRDLDISIDVTALVRPGICTPKLTMSWSTMLDFTLPVNPGFGNSLTNPPLQRSHRPSQLSIDGNASLVAPAVSRPDSLPSLEAATARNAETTIPDFGITMTFTAPTKPVFAGDEFSWSVFVVNRTSATAITNPANPAAAPAPRKLALVAIPRRRRNDVRVLRPPSTAGRHKASSAGGARVQGGQAAELVADAVLEDNIVHAMQRSSLVDGTDVVCLSADARVGPLAPSACHVVELRFLALREGVVGIEAVRVVDLATQEHVDVRDLPVMVVQRREEVAAAA